MAGPKLSPILAVPFYLCAHRLTQNYHIWRGNTYRVGAYIKVVSHAPPKGRGPSAPQFWGFLSIYVYTFCRIVTKFHMVTRMGKGLVFSCSATPPPQGAESQLSPIFGLLSIYVSEIRVSWTQPRLPPQDRTVQRSPISGILLYFSLHHLTQKLGSVEL